MDIENRLVVTADVVDRCNDKRELAPALKELGALAAALGKPVRLLVDTGYFSREKESPLSRYSAIAEREMIRTVQHWIQRSPPHVAVG